MISTNPIRAGRSGVCLKAIAPMIAIKTIPTAAQIA